MFDHVLTTQGGGHRRTNVNAIDSNGPLIPLCTAHDTQRANEKCHGDVIEEDL